MKTESVMVAARRTRAEVDGLGLEQARRIEASLAAGRREERAAARDLKEAIWAAYDALRREPTHHRAEDLAHLLAQADPEGVASFVGTDGLEERLLDDALAGDAEGAMEAYLDQVEDEITRTADAFDEKAEGYRWKMLRGVAKDRALGVPLHHLNALEREIARAELGAVARVLREGPDSLSAQQEFWAASRAEQEANDYARAILAGTC
ncbi:hypothetical protein [Streptomyces albireticuli]|uniref:Uncharacterized protein n=1 Tax=Streptomyces albireticuli TaxID=1940 RepID=A0A2A2CYJ9_9ACTN|nr:hypothetical protein [Streptomyces albireticuli]MCD9145925.1 hypothetical protein [Streptomyces albireticuli]MCD9166095.1 hypothetical protein [Streptomyces albireticuli]MCD9196375.1 hypothetical protein [Streptomyces albireticuli]PAU45298.1 hypothetical protein CK936_30255 [Streptomyces albireticuli]